MAVSAGGVYVDLGLNAARFHDGLKRAGKELDGFGSRAQKAGGIARAALAGVGDGLKLALAGFTAAGALAGFRAVTSDLAQLNAEAKRAGVTAEALQEIGYAAKQSRIGLDALVDGLKEMSLRADEYISTGQGSAAESFARLGYSIDDVRTKLADPAAFFEEIIDKLATLDKAAQIRIADELFGGTGGEQFVQLLDKGAGHIARMRKEARDTGAVISNELIQQAEELNRKFDAIVTTVGTGLKQAIVGAVNVLAQFVDMLNQVNNQSTATIQKRLDLAREALPRYRNYGFPESYVKEREREIAALEAELASRPPAITINPSPGSAPSPASTKKGDGKKDIRTTYGDLIQVANERIAQLQVEQQALYLTTDAAEALRLKEELLAYAKRDNINLSPEELKGLEEKAGLYGKLTAEVERAAQAQAEISGLGRDVVGGIVADLRNGVSAADAFANALDNVADKLLDMSLNALFEPGGGGFLSAVLSGLAKGGAVTPLGMGGIGHAAVGGRIRGAGTGTSDSIPMMLSDGEYVVRAAQAKKFSPLLEAINSGQIGKMAAGGMVGAAPRLPSLAGMSSAGRRGGDTIHMTMNMPIDARGATPDAVELLGKRFDKLQKGLPRQMVETIRQARLRGAKI